MTNIRQYISRFHSWFYVCMCVSDCSRFAVRPILWQNCWQFYIHCIALPDPFNPHYRYIAIVCNGTLSYAYIYISRYSTMDKRYRAWKMAQNAALTQIIYYLCMPLNENGKE